jgi:hypothetical protein
MRYCKAFSNAANIHFDGNTFIVTACSNSAAALINGTTIHSVAKLNSKRKNVRANRQSVDWKNVKMILIDEISFLSSRELIKLDSNLRKLTGRKGMLYGGLHMIFVGDFFQLDPVSGQPVYSGEANICWQQAINACVFLDVPHRFKNDPEWGKLLQRLRMGNITPEDVKNINERLIKYHCDIKVQAQNPSYACSTNKQRNIISDAVFENVVKASNEEDTHV